MAKNRETLISAKCARTRQMESKRIANLPEIRQNFLIPFPASFFPTAMPKRDRSPESSFPARRPAPPTPEAPTSLADTLARIRRKALERVTDQLNGKPTTDESSLFGDIRRSVGKAVKERAETAGFPPTLAGNLG